MFVHSFCQFSFADWKWFPSFVMSDKAVADEQFEYLVYTYMKQ